MANKRQQDFIKRYAPTAQRVSKDTGIPASIILAQAALESGWGNSGLSKNANNMFGVKGKGDAGVYWSPTGEYKNGKYVVEQAGFRNYSSVEESFRDHAKVLQAQRYKGIIGSDFITGARILQDGGYATDPQYADKLINLIATNNLSKYDPKGSMGNMKPLPNIKPYPGSSSGGGSSRPASSESVGYEGELPLLGHLVKFIILIILFVFVLWNFMKMADSPISQVAKVAGKLKGG